MPFSFASFAFFAVKKLLTAKVAKAAKNVGLGP
jgi:hypothetical protein